jgi:glycerate dehydrogenase
MKPTSIIINTSRGDTIDEKALADALNEKRIYAAGLDVLSEEPPKETNPLISAKNCYITPHYAWATCSARKKLIEIAVSNLKAFIDGNPQNNVAV